MTNKEISRKFNNLAKIMELHGENPFKIRSYRNAYNTLRKLDRPLADMTLKELNDIPGVGKAIADKIRELIETGKLNTYNKYADITPDGIIEMLGVRGFGPKKIEVIWKELEITTIGELLYACSENRLVELKGFGHKTQEKLKTQLQYYIDSQGKYLYGFLIDEVDLLMDRLRRTFPDNRHEVTGDLRKLNPIINTIEVITTCNQKVLLEQKDNLGLNLEHDQFYLDNYPINFQSHSNEEFGSVQFKLSTPAEWQKEDPLPRCSEEGQVFKLLNIPYIQPEFRDYPDVLDLDLDQFSNIITEEDIKGVVHSHSTYSDGIHSIEDMAKESIKMGYQYLVMTDHSKVAVYANGLSEDRVIQQFEEIDQLNSKLKPFRIFKGIEADILADGSMDYGNDFLSNFELVIASIHSILQMDKEKATSRLIRAIENPNTHILGHPTGRLLLSRKGYPIDHMTVIDACAANGMIIELNSNPLRLDLDWTWIPYAMEKGVRISINPDSHNKDSIDYIKFGVNVARKALLTKDMCLNALTLVDFEKWVKTL
jgi:DNA polymerase (family 10)